MYNFFTIVTTFATFIIAFAQVRQRLGYAKLKVSGLSFCISEPCTFASRKLGGGSEIQN